MESNQKNEFLWKYFENIRFWVEYAEKKNAVLFTIVGFEMAILKFLEKPANIQFLTITICILSVAFLISLLSFLPKTDRLEFLGLFRPAKHEYALNLLFFGEIKNYNPQDLLQKLNERYRIGLDDDQFIVDICDQAVILSRIASAKLEYFKYAFYVTVCGQISLFAVLFVNLIF